MTYRTLFFPAILGVLMVWPLTVRANDEIDLLNQRLESLGLDWTAGETNMTRLTPQERSRRLMPDYPFPDGFELGEEGFVDDERPRLATWASGVGVP